jgi:uncharacterized cupin superfamily protein
MGLTHLDEARAGDRKIGHLRARWTRLGEAAGSVNVGLRRIQIPAGGWSTPAHDHGGEEEIFVILEGDGALLLDEVPTPVRSRHVAARPAGTGIAHVFRAGESGMSFLAYGTREPGDLCFYPRSGKIAFRGLGVIARVQALDYWDGED